ncbi:MAG: hypothetical protein IPM48_05995 [Saprospiraceae bacterium]|nr:hypothetical protein [Saprospiraceae bacterium]
MKLVQLLIIVAGLTLISCSPQLTPLTQKIIDKNHWGPDELTRMQFYLSDDIVLRREVSTSRTAINKGKIKNVNGAKIEEIIIERGTPGVMLFSPKENRIAVSFESTDKESYLMFGPNPKFDQRYLLLGKEWDRHSGMVTYNGQEYSTSSHSAFAGLLVNLKQSNRVEKKTQVVGGRKI